MSFDIEYCQFLTVKVAPKINYGTWEVNTSQMQANLWLNLRKYVVNQLKTKVKAISKS